MLALCVVAPPSADAATVTLGWDANDEPDLEGYVVYRNTGSPGPPYQYSDEVPEEELDDPLHPETTLTDLQEGNKYYIALTAYNTEDVESGFSNNICVEVVDGVVEPCSQSIVSSASPSSSSALTSSGSSGGSDGGGSSGGGGGGGGVCFISASGADASMFFQWIAPPVIGSQVLAMFFLPLVLIFAVKLILVDGKSKKEIFDF